MERYANHYTTRCVIEIPLESLLYTQEYLIWNKVYVLGKYKENKILLQPKFGLKQITNNEPYPWDLEYADYIPCREVRHPLNMDKF